MSQLIALLSRSKLFFVPAVAAASVGMAAFAGTYSFSRTVSAQLLGLKTTDLTWREKSGVVTGSAFPPAAFLIAREALFRPPNWRQLRAKLDAAATRSLPPGAPQSWGSRASNTMRALRVPARYYTVNLLATAALAGVGASLGQRAARKTPAPPQAQAQAPESTAS